MGRKHIPSSKHYVHRGNGLMLIFFTHCYSYAIISEFERSREREWRKRKRYPVASVIERLLGDAVSSLMDSYNESVDEDLYVCEQALRAVNGQEN